MSQSAVDGVHRNCYAVECTARHRQGTGNLFKFPRNPDIWPLIHMPYNPFLVPNRVHKLPHTDFRVITECSIIASCITMRVAFFFLHCKFFEYDKFRTQFLMEHALITLSVQYWGWLMHEQCFILGLWYNHFFIYLFTVQNCGMIKSADYAQWRKLGL